MRLKVIHSNLGICTMPEKTKWCMYIKLVLIFLISVFQYTIVETTIKVLRRTVSTVTMQKGTADIECCIHITIDKVTATTGALGVVAVAKATCIAPFAIY